MNRLLQATGDGEIKWGEGADDAYFAAQKDANLHIRHRFDPDTGDVGFEFRIVRGQGEAAFIVLGDSPDDFSLMRDLYASISVNAAGGGALVEGLFA